MTHAKWQQKINITACDKISCTLKKQREKPKNCTKLVFQQSHTSAKKKIWETVKRLHFDGDKTIPYKLPT